MVRLCQAMHCLPESGGILDQDGYWVWIMQLVLNADAVRQELDQAGRASGA